MFKPLLLITKGWLGLPASVVAGLWVSWLYWNLMRQVCIFDLALNKPTALWSNVFLECTYAYGFKHFFSITENYDLNSFLEIVSLMPSVRAASLNQNQEWPENLMDCLMGQLTYFPRQFQKRPITEFYLTFFSLPFPICSEVGWGGGIGELSGSSVLGSIWRGIYWPSISIFRSSQKSLTLRFFMTNCSFSRCVIPWHVETTTLQE